MVYFRLNRSMQVCAPLPELWPKQKASGLFFCNNNTRPPATSTMPGFLPSTLRRAVQRFSLRRRLREQEPRGAVNEVLRAQVLTDAP
jgi:hypothetical protein